MDPIQITPDLAIKIVEIFSKRCPSILEEIVTQCKADASHCPPAALTPPHPTAALTPPPPNAALTPPPSAAAVTPQQPTAALAQPQLAAALTPAQFNEPTRFPPPGFEVDPQSPSDMEVEAESSKRPISSSDEEWTVVGGKRRPKKSRPSPPTEDEPSSSNSASPSPRASPTPRAPLESESQQGRKPRPPPPVVIQDKAAWTRVTNALKAENINYSKASNSPNGISVIPMSTDDHRKLTAHLRKEKVAFHTYTLEEDRTLRVVIRGVPKEFPPSIVLEDLKSQGYPAREVHRMAKPNGKPYEMVLTVLDRTAEGKQIFNLNKLCNLTGGFNVEPPHKRGIPSQCHNCQLYGHSARNCHAPPRCVKCIGDHATSECERKKETATEPPGCVLCGTIGHPANYRGCPRAPKRNRRVARRNLLRASNPAPYPTAPSAPVAPITPTTPFVPAPSASSMTIPQTHAPSAPQVTASTAVRDPRINRPVPSAHKPNAWNLPTPIAPTRPVAVSQISTAGHGNQMPSTQLSGLYSDIQLIRAAMDKIDTTEIRTLAHKLRVATSPFERTLALIEHQNLTNSLATLPIQSSSYP